MLKKFSMIITLVIIIAVGLQVPAMANPIPVNHVVSLWPEYDDNQVLFMEGVELPASTPLPAEVKVAIPKGASVIWAGEIMGGDASQDIQATHKVNPKDSYDEVVFTLTKSRKAQVEAKWVALTVNGQERTLTLDWIQRYPAEQTTFVFRVPTQASDIKMSPPEGRATSQGQPQEFRETEPMRLEIGQKQAFTITYKRNTNVPSISDQQAQQQPGQPQGAASNSSSNDVATIVLVLIAATVVVALFYLKSKHISSNADDYEEEEVSGSEKATAYKAASAKQERTSKPTGKQASAGNSKTAIIAVIAITLIAGAAVTGAVLSSGGPPSGDNCGQNVAYLQAGVDKYKQAFGEYPTDLKQLLETKDGKGPFVETIDYKCPTDGSPYAVINGVVQQVPAQ